MAYRTIEERLKEANDTAEEKLKTVIGGEGTPEGAPGDGEKAGGTPSEDFEQKYKVLKGKYDKEIPRLYQMANEFETKARAATEELEKVKSTLQDEGAKPIAFDESNLPPEVKEFKDEYPDIYKGMLSMFKATPKRAESKPVEKPAEKPRETPKPKDQTPVVWSEAMYQVLTSKCANWNAINKNPEFIGWLTGKDRYARKTRGMLLSEAYNAGDIETVANIMTDFEDFHIKKADETPPDDVAPTTTPGRVSAPGTDANKGEAVTRAFVAKFYSDVALGKYKGREKDMAAIEAKINQAAAKRAIT